MNKKMMLQFQKDLEQLLKEVSNKEKLKNKKLKEKTQKIKELLNVLKIENLKSRPGRENE